VADVEENQGRVVCAENCKCFQDFARNAEKIIWVQFLGESFVVVMEENSCVGVG